MEEQGNSLMQEVARNYRDKWGLLRVVVTVLMTGAAVPVRSYFPDTVAW